ncbi:CRTAC1 family protein [Foetidibacter luteolus]|uniref:CRTAC1 family protein n=1 Tax=Foetidibacter luteolus TaxID=2608880 RepID=UPI00129B7E38|nr:CRTAC1 family protein [Foetidibacter luteolus]
MKQCKHLLIIPVILLFNSCRNEVKVSANTEMVGLLSTVSKNFSVADNSFASQAKLNFYDSALKAAERPQDSAAAKYFMANVLLEMGQEQKSIPLFEDLLRTIPLYETDKKRRVMKDLALSWLRVGERTNCITGHGTESCIFPVKGNGVHRDKAGSERAIEIYRSLLKEDPSDLETRWLLNIAYMTIAGYPQQVPAEWLIKGLDADTSSLVKPFMDVAVNTGLNTKNMAGGSIVEDFNNDGYLDIVTSSWGLDEGMHFCINKSGSGFADMSDSSGLQQFTGGLNIMQTDYNNDGLKDIFVLRGAWKGRFGKEPNSLLKNNGNGTFTDVTKESGLLSFYPTQTATWADFNNDGWLDVFIGNETSTQDDVNPCELFISNKNGTFTNMADKAGCSVTAFVKGVTSGDYDNDGLTDIFISTLNGLKVLLKNEGSQNGIPHFKDVSVQAGVSNNTVRTFPTWFWDYDNDGWLDIFVCSYEFNRPPAWYAAAEALQIPTGNGGRIFLYHNKHDGTFEEVGTKIGLNKIAFTMGCNFGDIDNDGWLDMYLGTGNPQYTSLVPNKMFKNINGKSFVDVTTSARVGNLQKGHGVSFADLDNDGDQDIYIDMGGAYSGDAYQNSLYVNPGQNNNRWVNISLQGVNCNRAAIGARLKLTFTENGKTRTIYRHVNSGGSFGSNPLLQHIGIGQATAVETVEIKWPGNNNVQVVKNLKAGDQVLIRQGSDAITKVKLNKSDYTFSKQAAIGCSPN